MVLPQVFICIVLSSFISRCDGQSISDNYNEQDTDIKYQEKLNMREEKRERKEIRQPTVYKSEILKTAKYKGSSESNSNNTPRLKLKKITDVSRNDQPGIQYQQFSEDFEGNQELEEKLGKVIKNNKSSLKLYVKSPITSEYNQGLRIKSPITKQLSKRGPEKRIKSSIPQQYSRQDEQSYKVLLCTSSWDCRVNEICIGQFCQDPCKIYPCETEGTVCKVMNHERFCEDTGLMHLKSADNCLHDDDCESNRACVQGNCINPCERSPCVYTNPNACVVINHKPVCKNISILQCETRWDCKPDKICIGQYCQDPCQFIPCDIEGTVCRVINHERLCEGLVSVDFKSDVGCNSNADCNTYQACFNGNCIDPCKSSPCGNEGAFCSVVNHIHVCGNTSNGGCTSDDLCESNKACLNGNCVNPCEFTQCKIKKIVCTVINHIPVCGNSTDIGCYSNGDCKPDEFCIDHYCLNPCQINPCEGNGTVCKVINQMAVCEVLPAILVSDIRCRVDEDCGPQKACVSGMCIDPCSLTLCNTVCFVTNHKAVCPYPSSEPCQSNNNCVSDRACIAGYCIDPCYARSCHMAGAICIVNNHNPFCIQIGFDGYCKSNYDCNVYEACVDQYCVNPCQHYLCQYGAICQVVNHTPFCRQTGLLPPTPGGMCGFDYECSLNEACIGRQCINPCIIACGGSYCNVVNHIPVCQEPGSSPSIPGNQYAFRN